MNSCLGKIRISWTILHNLQRNPFLYQKLRTRTLFLSHKFFDKPIYKNDKQLGGKIIFEKAFEPISDEVKLKNRTSLYYLSAFTLLVSGFTYMSVLLYRMYCQVTFRNYYFFMIIFVNYP